MDYSDFSLVRLKIDDHSKGVDDIKVHFGTFSEINVDRLDRNLSSIQKKCPNNNLLRN